ncbi:MAG: mannosyltransferase family protein [Acidimicrobiales bacterium]
MTLFAVVAIALYLIVAAANAWLPRSNDSDHQAEVPAQSILGGWLAFDSTWYVDIAQNGYYYTKGQQSSVAFFPAYPLTVRALSTVTGSESLAGVLITLASGVGIAALWWIWLRSRLEGRARSTAFALLMLFPYAWFIYGSDYADAFFLVLVLGAFVAADRERWLLVGLLGGLASAARPVAPAVIIGLACVALDRSGVLRRERPAGGGRPRFAFDSRALRPALAWVALSITGLAAWCAYLWRRFGDPVAFLTVQEAPGWAQPAGPHTWFKLTFVDLVAGGHLFALRLIPQAVVTVAFLAFVPAVARRFGWGYGAYVLVVIGIPALGTGDFQGMGRYCLAAFPVFALVGEWVIARGRTWMAPALLATSGTCLAVGAALFGTGFYLT